MEELLILMTPHCDFLKFPLPTMMLFDAKYEVFPPKLIADANFHPPDAKER